MKMRIIISFTSIVLICLFCVAGANSSDYESTPIEQDDIKSIDEINEDTSDVFEATPAEQDDIKTIDQLNN